MPWGLSVFLVAAVIAVAGFQAPMWRFDRFAILDSGGELAMQDLIGRGYRPTIDFGYLYGLLPLLVGRTCYGLLGLSPSAFGALVMACAAISAWGMARVAAYRRVGPAGVVLVALAIPDLLRVTYIGLVQSLEQVLLIHALAEQARARRAASLALLTACWFVKPSLAFVQGLAVLLAMAVAWHRRADRTGPASVLALGPPAVTAVVFALLLAAAFGPRPLLTSLLPRTGMQVYRLGGFGFFHGIGRDFWVLPHAGLIGYFRYEVGFWLLATFALAWAGLAGFLRLAGNRSTGDQAVSDEICATCAFTHLGFVCFLFGHRGTWFYSWPMLILGLATLPRRGRWQASTIWVLALLLLVNDRSKALDILRRWRTDAPTAVTLNLWADTQEQAEWARALELTRGQEPVLLSMCDGAALLIPGFQPPAVGYLVPGNALPVEVRRKAAQLARATLVISAYPPDWPGFVFWPEIRAALDGCTLVMEGQYIRVYRRAAGSLKLRARIN
jgi:hypothetical protein